ncbi:hypothetical protein C8R46DRAFT_1357153 [Mycena filopes]|nr:hypothetical protein C8R46DRAFT_1357153 [Mycena filopes]
MPPHACFDMKKIAKLPIRIRRLVEGVFDDSVKSLENLTKIEADLDVKEKAHFLPVFDKLLHAPPASAKPASSRSEEEHQQLRRFAVRGYPVLKPLETVRGGSLFPRSALADVWERIWGCIMIHDEYIDEFPDFDVLAAEVWHLHLLIILTFGTWKDLPQLSKMRDQLKPALISPPPPLDSLVSDTPRLRQYLTAVWAHMVHDKLVRRACGTPMCWIFPSFLRASEERTFVDMLVGAGGTALDLSSLVIKHLKVAAADLSDPTGDLESIFQSLACVLSETVVQNEIPLMESLAAQGLVESLVSLSTAVQALQDRIGRAVLLGTQLNITFIMKLVFQLPAPQPWIVEGLRAGLLKSVAVCVEADMAGNNPLTGLFNTLLGTILPGHLTSYAVVSRLEKALVRLDDSGLTHRFMQPLLRDAWTKLKTLADERIAMKIKYDGEAQRSERMCDSLKCNKIIAKTSLRRCSQCLDMYYCSPECQKADWASGGHRKFCRHLPKKGGIDTSTREKSFLRFLLHADYLSHKHKILSLRPEYLLSDNATTDPFYVTEFDYSSGPLQLRVLPAKPFITTRLPLGVARLAGGYQLRRAVADRGKMTLDVAVVADGSEARCWVFPMRSTSNVIYNGLRRLVREKAAMAGLDQYDEAIRELSRASGFEEVH